MPDQFVNEMPTDAIAGAQIRIRSSASGTPTIRPRMSLSWRVSRLYRRFRRTAATAPVPASAWTGAAGVVVGSATAQDYVPAYFSGGRESQNCCIVPCRFDGFAVGLARKF